MQHFVSSILRDDPLFHRPLETGSLESIRERAYFQSRRLLEYDFLNAWAKIQGRPFTERERASFSQLSQQIGPYGAAKLGLSVQVINCIFYLIFVPLFFFFAAHHLEDFGK